MKKKLAVLVSIFMIFALSACGRTQNATPTAEQSSAETTSMSTESETTQTVTTQSVTTDDTTSTEKATADNTASTENAAADTATTDAAGVEGAAQTTEAASENNAVNDTDGTTASNVLVVYFSATGMTKGVAEKIADGTNADIYEITPETPYTDADLNYHDNKSRSTIEMNDESARPAISGSVENMEQYDIIFVGYPIWWGEAPRILCTFVESYDFTGKTVVPFCTSASSGVGSSATNLEKLTSGANWLAGKRFSGGESAGTVMDWVNGLNLFN